MATKDTDGFRRDAVTTPLTKLSVTSYGDQIGGPSVCSVYNFIFSVLACRNVVWRLGQRLQRHHPDATTLVLQNKAAIRHKAQ
jgi:hypothetical protein